MQIEDRYELAAKLRVEYDRAGRTRKGEILDGLCMATGYNRRYAMAVLSRYQVRKEPDSRVPRVRRYGEEFSSALETLWEASGYVCAERLQPFLPELLSLLESHREIEVDAEPAS